jgi:hypothetical protein
MVARWRSRSRIAMGLAAAAAVAGCAAAAPEPLEGRIDRSSLSGRPDNALRREMKHGTCASRDADLAALDARIKELEGKVKTETDAAPPTVEAAFARWSGLSGNLSADELAEARRKRAAVAAAIAEHQCG